MEYFHRSAGLAYRARCKLVLFMHSKMAKEVFMKYSLALGLLVAARLAAAPVVPQAEKSQVAKMSLKVGDVAPEFTLLSDGWKTVKLSDFRGKKNVFLAVYVLAFTGVEPNNFRRSRLESPPVKSTPRIRKFSASV